MGGTRWRSLRHCTTSRKVAGSIQFYGSWPISSTTACRPVGVSHSATIWIFWSVLDGKCTSKPSHDPNKAGTLDVLDSPYHWQYVLDLATSNATARNAAVPTVFTRAIDNLNKIRLSHLWKQPHWFSRQTVKPCIKQEINTDSLKKTADKVTGIFFRWHNPSGLIMALGSTVTEMSTTNISWG